MRPLANCTVTVRLKKQHGQLLGEQVSGEGYISMTDEPLVDFFGYEAQAEIADEGKDPYWASSIWMKKQPHNEWLQTFRTAQPIPSPYPKTENDLRAFLLGTFPSGFTTAYHPEHGFWIGFSIPDRKISKKKVKRMDRNQPWSAYRYCVIDLEGTGGQDAENEAILEVAAVPIIDGKVKKDFFHTLVNPERKIPKRHWISFTNEDLKEAPTFGEIREELFSYLDQSILIAHQARVDWRVLKRKYPHFHPILLDTLTLSRKLYPNEKKHSLDDLTQRFNLAQYTRKLFAAPQRHRAHVDAWITAYAFLAMCQAKLSPATTLAQLVQLCGIETITYEQGNLFDSMRER